MYLFYSWSFCPGAINTAAAKLKSIFQIFKLFIFSGGGKQVFLFAFVSMQKNAWLRDRAESEYGAARRVKFVRKTRKLKKNRKQKFMAKRIVRSCEIIFKDGTF